MQRVLKYLRKQGIKVWLDNEKLISRHAHMGARNRAGHQKRRGDPPDRSPDFNNSEWVRREITFAERYRKRIFPVLASGDETTSISIRLSTRQYVDIRQDQTLVLAHWVSGLVLSGRIGNAGKRRTKDKGGPGTRTDRSGRTSQKRTRRAREKKCRRARTEYCRGENQEKKRRT